MKITEYFNCVQLIADIKIMAEELDLEFMEINAGKSPYFLLKGEAVRKEWGGNHTYFYNSVEDVFYYLQGMMQGTEIVSMKDFSIPNKNQGEIK